MCVVHTPVMRMLSVTLSTTVSVATATMGMDSYVSVSHRTVKPLGTKDIHLVSIIVITRIMKAVTC